MKVGEQEQKENEEEEEEENKEEEKEEELAIGRPFDAALGVCYLRGGRIDGVVGDAICGRS